MSFFHFLCYGKTHFLSSSMMSIAVSRTNKIFHYNLLEHTGLNISEFLTKVLRNANYLLKIAPLRVYHKTHLIKKMY